MDAVELGDRIAALRGGGSVRPLQIYLHVPFCASKCHFCDWVDDIPTVQLTSGPRVRRRYADALCRQIEFWGPRLTAIGYRPHSIYWGGGTPTRLDPGDLDRIGRALAASFDMSALVQHSLESTPNDLTPEKLERLAAIGVDRLSIGVQSFDPEQLRRAGRAHSAEQAIAAVRLAQQSGIADINLDLISGFPDERLGTFRKTLELTVALDVTHVSVYSYRATRRTIMAMQVHDGVRQALDLDEMIASYEVAQEVLSAAGYDEYCFNYFAKDTRYRFDAGLYGYQLTGDIIGFGAGATSTIGHLSLGNPETPIERFIEDPSVFDSVTSFGVGRPEMLFPLFGGALMTQGGLNFERFESLTGVSFQQAWSRPEVRAWFQYIKNCGAVLRTEHDGIRAADRRNIHRVYLRNLAYTLNASLVERAVPGRDPGSPARRAVTVRSGDRP